MDMIASTSVPYSTTDVAELLKTNALHVDAAINPMYSSLAAWTFLTVQEGLAY